MFTCNGEREITDLSQADISEEDDLEESVQRVPVLGKSTFPALPCREEPKPLIFISCMDSEAQGD